MSWVRVSHLLCWWNFNFYIKCKETLPFSAPLTNLIILSRIIDYSSIKTSALITTSLSLKQLFLFNWITTHPVFMPFEWIRLIQNSLMHLSILMSCFRLIHQSIPAILKHQGLGSVNDSEMRTPDDSHDGNSISWLPTPFLMRDISFQQIKWIYYWIIFDLR